MLLFRTAILTAASILIVSTAPTVAGAVPTTNLTKAQALAQQIENGLHNLGCDASRRDEVSAIESIVAASGVDPEVARAALRLVRLDPNLCGNDGLALNSVERTIAGAENAYWPPQSGPHGGPPIGPPPSFVGDNGTDYLPH